MSATKGLLVEMRSAVGVGVAKIHVLEPFDDEGAPGAVVHQVRHKDDLMAMCGVDISNAAWTKRGPICVVCEDIEDSEFEEANPGWNRGYGLTIDGKPSPTIPVTWGPR